jgi:hypothetical protein
MENNLVSVEESAVVEVKHEKRTLSGRKRKDMSEWTVWWSLPEPQPKVVKERTGEYYQQEFPVLTPRPLTDLERAASAQRGFIRRDRRRTRNG